MTGVSSSSTAALTCCERRSTWCPNRTTRCSCGPAPWPYLNLHRVPATRFIWKNFLLGEIYLARSGPQYVLPGTWETFAADVERTDPAAFVVETVNPVVPGTPFETLVDDNFTTVYTDDVATLAYRNDLARWLRSPPVDPTSTPDVGLDPDAPESLAATGCVRLDGDIVSEAPDEANVSFRFGSSANVGDVTPTILFTRTSDGFAAVRSREPSGIRSRCRSTRRRRTPRRSRSSSDHGRQCSSSTG